MNRTAPTAPPAPRRPGGDPYESPDQAPDQAVGSTPGGRPAAVTGFGLQGTPGRMRLVAAVLVVVGLLVGLAGAQSFFQADGALERADRNAAQLVRLQEIQTLLVRADADATNAFLVGGLEPVDQRRDYDEAVARAVEQVAYAARAQPADGEVLAALSTAIQAYTGAVVQARAANRQGLPLGAQYLREASAGLRADALPLLGSLTAANEERVTTEFDAAGRARTLALVAGVLGVLVVVGALVWIARRTHRIVNVPVAGAGVVLLVVTVAAVVALGSVAATVGDVRDGSYASARALAGARIAAFDAKANESLTLVSRGSGAAFEAAWQDSSSVTSSALASAARIDDVAADLPTAWEAYTALHAEIRALDDGGAWEQAVAAAVSREPGSANTTFGAFDTASGEQLTAASDATSSVLRDARSGLAFAGWLCALAGVLAAALAWWGLSQRIEEYR